MSRLVHAMVLFGAVSLAGCGGLAKPAQDPASGPTSGNDTPKWDDSSESADNARHPHIASNSSSTSEDAANNKPSDAPAAPASPTQRGHRDDEYDKDATEMVLKRAARVVHDNCGAAKDENGKASGPWGKTTVSVNLGHNGRTKGATVDPSFDGKPVGRCIVQAFSNLTFPPWRGGDTSVNWDVEVVQPK